MLIAFVLTTYLSTFALCGEIKKYIWLPYKLMNIFVRYKRYIKKEIFYCQNSNECISPNCTFFRFQLTMCHRKRVLVVVQYKLVINKRTHLYNEHLTARSTKCYRIVLNSSSRLMKNNSRENFFPDIVLSLCSICMEGNYSYYI